MILLIDFDLNNNTSTRLDDGFATAAGGGGLPLAAREALAFLELSADAPSLEALTRIVDAYVHRVPWESASRIARRAACDEPEACVQWPQSFWRGAITQGTGGTCFESNYAMFWLLRALGYQGYLTVNNMGESVGCHTACVIELASARYLVDVGIPLHVPVPLDATQATQAEGPHHAYTITPEAANRFTVTRDRHPRPYIFTLIDEPVPDADYRAATTADYGPDGLFLDRMIITRIVDGRVWRFGSDSQPRQIEAFSKEGHKTYYLLGDDDDVTAKRVARHFGMDADITGAALGALAARATHSEIS